MRKLTKILPYVALLLLGICQYFNAKAIDDYSSFTLDYIKMHQEMTNIQNEEIIFLKEKLIETRKEVISILETTKQ